MDIVYVRLIWRPKIATQKTEHEGELDPITMNQS